MCYFDANDYGDPIAVDVTNNMTHEMGFVLFSGVNNMKKTVSSDDDINKEQSLYHVKGVSPCKEYQQILQDIYHKDRIIKCVMFEVLKHGFAIDTIIEMLSVWEVGRLSDNKLPEKVRFYKIENDPGWYKQGVVVRKAEFILDRFTYFSVNIPADTAVRLYFFPAKIAG